MPELKRRIINIFELMSLIIVISIVIWRLSEGHTSSFDVISLVSVSLFILVMQILIVCDNKLEIKLKK